MNNYWNSIIRGWILGTGFVYSVTNKIRTFGLWREIKRKLIRVRMTLSSVLKHVCKDSLMSWQRKKIRSRSRSQDTVSGASGSRISLAHTCSMNPDGYHVIRRKVSFPGRLYQTWRRPCRGELTLRGLSARYAALTSCPAFYLAC